MAASEQSVREHLVEALDSALPAIREEHCEGTKDLPERIVPLPESEFMTSDEGVALYYPDGSVWTVSVVCYRRPSEPGPEDV